MSDFSVRSDSVDVEQIMRQIRARIREKRGVDYTEAEVQQLASVKLEQFLDPRGLRSDLVEQFRRHRTVSAEPPKYDFEDTTLYDTHRGLLRAIRRMLNPILKLFINPNPLIQALHTQKQINDEFHKRFRQREEMEPLYYEVIHNLVVETTRLGIEVHNLKMRVESLSSRMDFDERRGRALEGVVQYKRPPSPAPRPDRTEAGPAAPNHARTGAETGSLPPGRAESGSASPQPGRAEAGPVAPHSARPEAGPAAPQPGRAEAADTQGGEQRRRRRRRRRRRPGQTAGDRQGMDSSGSTGSTGSTGSSGSTGSPGSAGSGAGVFDAGDEDQGDRDERDEPGGPDEGDELAEPGEPGEPDEPDEPGKVPNQ